MISSNLKSVATTLTNGIAMFIPSVQESLPDRSMVRWTDHHGKTVLADEGYAPRTILGELKKFLQMDYPEIVTIHWTSHHLEISSLSNAEI